MNTTGTYLAIFLGGRNSQRRATWDALPDAERRAKEQQGIAAWRAWADKHQSAIVTMGGPLGRTKQVSQSGLSDVSNQLAAYTVVRADSHEAAAHMFEKHPHFMIFPGDAIEIMPVLEIPAG